MIVILIISGPMVLYNKMCLWKTAVCSILFDKKWSKGPVAIHCYTFVQNKFAGLMDRKIDCKAVSAKSVHFKLHEDDTNEKILDTLKKLAEKKGFSHVLMTKNGDILLSDEKRIQIKNGERTLQSWLGTEHLPMRIRGYDPLPDSFLQHYFAEGYNAEKVLYKIGQKFEEAVINKIVKEKVNRAANKRRNEKMLQSDACEQTEENKNLYKKLKSRQELNPDLDKEYTITFQHRANGQPTSDYPPVTITIEAQPKAGYKRKHYYIYSHRAGFGKTYEMCQFAKKYNAALITNTNNWVDVPTEAQFLIFEELGKSNKLDFEQLKSLTGGFGLMSGNCKSYGSSFKPRQDVQVIIISSRSPYDIYGEWDKHLQRRIMSADSLSELEDRFHVIRLDGDILEDQMKYLEPTALTDAQFKKACIKQLTGLAIIHLGVEDVSSRAMLLTDKDVMKKYLKRCYSAFRTIYTMWLSRNADTNLVRQTINFMLEELLFGPALVDMVKSYFIDKQEFVKDKLLADNIDKFLSRPDVSNRIKMIVDDFDQLVGLIRGQAGCS